MNPLVTVYIPTKNRKELLKRAVLSVLNQTYENIELIVVNDRSEDETEVFLQEICKSDKRVSFYSNDISRGACYSRNIAISKSKGEFITGLDDDDYFSRERIEFLVRSWSENYLFSATSSIPHDYNTHFVTKLQKKLSKRSELIDFTKILKSNVVGNQIFCKTSLLKEYMFDDNLVALQDWELWIRLLKNSSKPAIKYSRDLMFIDTNHGDTRITTLNNRFMACSFLENKHSINLDLAKSLWKLEYKKSISTSEMMLVISNGFFRLPIKWLFKS
ncbi:glycosyltransferase [Vibrio breoganii]